MNSRQGLVSVIIPTYNRSAICRVAVESVLSQTYPNVEVILVDDGSVDDTRAVFSGMDGRVRYIHQKNSGVSVARNRGLQVAEGEYIALLDSDDSWLPWKLEAQLEVLRCFPAAGMTWTDMIVINENGHQLYESHLERMYDAYQYFDREKHFRENRMLCEVWKECPTEWMDRKCYVGNIFPWMFMGNLVHTSTVLMRAEWQRRVGLFDVSLLKSGEDYDYHFRTCRLGDVAYMDVSSIRYRVGAADQLTADGYNIWMARNDLKTITGMLAVACREITLSEGLIRERMSNCHAWIGMEEIFTDRKNARKHFRKCLKYDPFRMKEALYYLLSFFPYPFLNILRNTKRALSLVKNA